MTASLPEIVQPEPASVVPPFNVWLPPVNASEPVPDILSAMVATPFSVSVSPDAIVTVVPAPAAKVPP
ncbi:MAG: hypothetical protein ABSA49_12780 [Rhizomicrobium sp.]